MSTLFEDVQKHVEHAVAGLTGSDDFMPLLVVRDHQDRDLAIGMTWPGETGVGGSKDMVAASMAALCCLHRAKEAAFASVAWTIRPKPGEWDGTAPADSPDREETVMVAAIHGDGSSTLFTAPMVRENNLCGVGVWDQSPKGAVAGGRFAEAIRHGMVMGENIPPDMAAYIDSEMEAGHEGKMVEIFTRLYADHAVQAKEQARKEAKAREN